MLNSTYLRGTAILAALSVGISGLTACSLMGSGDDNPELFNGVNSHKLGNPYHSVKQSMPSATSVYVSSQPDGTLLGDSNGDKIDDGATFMGNTEAFFTVALDLDNRSMQEMISGNGSADLNFASVQVDASVNFGLENAADEHTGTYTLFARVKPKKAVLLAQEDPNGEFPGVEVIGTGAGLQPTSDFKGWHDSLGSGSAFINKVGDEFIHAIEYGSWLMVTLKFTYRNAEDKREIGGTIAVDWTKIGVDGAIQFQDAEAAKNVSISIHGQQFGGDSERLTTILPDNIFECQPIALETCSEIFSNAIQYMVEDYPTQFVDSAGNTDLSQYRHVRYITARYDESGPDLASYVTTGAEKLSFQSRQALRKINFQWEAEEQNERRALHLLQKRAADLTPEQADRVREIQSLARANAGTLEGMASTCLNGGPDTCKTAWEARSLHQYDELDLEI